MPKTYADLTVGNATAGNAILASDFATLFTNSNNMRVPPMCRVRRNAAQTIANNTQRCITWDTEDLDTDGMFTASSTTITIQTAGVYLITASISYDLNTTSTRGVTIVRNPTLTGTGDAVNVTAGTRIATTYVDRSPDTQTGVTTMTIFSCAATDTLVVIGYQNSGGNLATSTGVNEQTTCSVAWIGQAT